MQGCVFTDINNGTLLFLSSYQFSLMYQNFTNFQWVINQAVLKIASSKFWFIQINSEILQYYSYLAIHVKLLSNFQIVDFFIDYYNKSKTNFLDTFIAFICNSVSFSLSLQNRSFILDLKHVLPNAHRGAARIYIFKGDI